MIKHIENKFMYMMCILINISIMNNCNQNPVENSINVNIGDMCTLNSDCSSNFRCVDGSCIESVRACQSRIDCVVGETCLDEVCVIDTTVDQDRDGIPDRSDNCPEMNNSDQNDTDEDGAGDLCDDDDDNDGFLDVDDNCPLKVNVSQNDSDQDGSGDACDQLDQIEVMEDQGVELEQQIIRQPDPEHSKDIWTTNVYSYAPGVNGAGGGLNNDVLKMGGWSDLYYILIQFDLGDLPYTATSAHIELYCSHTDGNGTTGVYVDRITEPWDWRTQGTGADRDRLWWADLPDATPWFSDPLPSPIIEKWYQIEITDLYNRWRSGDLPNYGILLRPVSTNNLYNIFWSSEYMEDASLRPKLVITP